MSDKTYWVEIKFFGDFSEQQLTPLFSAIDNALESMGVDLDYARTQLSVDE